MGASARSLARLVLRRGLRGLAATAVWTLWLGLVLTLAVQAYMATHHELGVPGFVLRGLEERLAASGLRAEFGRTLFDPSGRILIRDVRITLPGFEEPAVSAGAIYGRIDWWAMLAGRFEPVELRVTGVTARIPAMLSPSGRADEIVRDLDGTFYPRGADVAVPFVTALIGGVKVAGQGTFHVAMGGGGAGGPLPLAELIARQYVRWARQAASFGPWLATLDRPVARADWVRQAPDATRIDFALSAEGAQAPEPAGVEGAGLRLEGSWLLSTEAIPLRLTARCLRLPGGERLDGVTARLTVSPAAGELPFRVETVDFAVRRAAGRGLTVSALMGRVRAADYPRVGAELAAWVWDHPVVLSAEGDAATRSGRVDFQAAISPRILDTIQATLHSDLRSFLSWTQPIGLTGRARFGPGGALRDVSGVVTARGINARGVQIDELRGEIGFDGSRLTAPRAYARLGDDFARGSFEEELASGRYRFLLEGRLRPLHITPWIAGEWWKDFFGNLEFPRQGPDANIDLSGSWTDGRQARIFLRVDAPGIGIQGMPLDALRGRLFLRPQFTDVLAFTAQRSGGAAEGSFVRRYDLEAGDWRSFDVTVNSTLDPLPPLKLLGGAEAAAIGDFTFVAPPHLTVAGHFDGPASAAGVHRQLRVGMRSDGQTSYRGIPIDRLGFDAVLTDDAVALTGIDAAIAGGRITGQVTVSGGGPAPHLEVSAAARDLSLTQAAALVQKLSAAPAGANPAKTPKFLQEKSLVKLDAALSAQGNWPTLETFHGAGSAQLRGGEIGEIHMLGMLSQLLRFTALRFNAAHATFRLDGGQLNFPDLVIAGNNAAITARGTYAIALHQLDFRARLDPFKQSQGATRKFMDLVLTPLSNALEVRLTGTIDRPKWAFVNGPTNLLWGQSPTNSLLPLQTGFANPP